MQDGKLRLRLPTVLNLPASDAKALVDAGNGDAALLYLHILYNGGALDTARAATALHRSDREIEQAAGRLRQMGLLSGSEAPPAAPVPEPEPRLPEYRAEDVTRRSMDSEAFRSLLEAVQLSLGRLLSSADVKKLFGLYDELGMLPEVILLLVEHCKLESEARYGKKRNVGFAAIEKEAYAWVNREIVTYDQAEEWLRELERRRSALGRLQTELGIRDRALSRTETAYLTGWLELGFPVESILIAADRTITNTHDLTWKYMDSILRSWHEAGLHTPEEIEKGDPRPLRSGGRAPAAKPAPARDDGKTLDQLARLRDKMKNQS